VSLVTVLRSCVVSWSLRFDWSIAVSSDRRPVTLQDAIRHLSEAYPDQNGIIQKVEKAATYHSQPR
jgi:hypothetical protein